MPTDKELLERIREVLAERLDADPYAEDGAFARQIRTLPVGLRAMAATNFLDVSLVMDDLPWHFLNFGEPGLVEETSRGLRELGLNELGDVFDEAVSIVCPLLSRVSENVDLERVLEEAGHSARIDELNSKAWSEVGADAKGDDEWAICRAWAAYARRYPEKVFG